LPDAGAYLPLGAWIEACPGQHPTAASLHQFTATFYLLGVQFCTVLAMSVNRMMSVCYPTKHQQVRA